MDQMTKSKWQREESNSLLYIIIYLLLSIVHFRLEKKELGYWLYDRRALGVFVTAKYIHYILACRWALDTYTNKTKSATAPMNLRGRLELRENAF